MIKSQSSLKLHERSQNSQSNSSLNKTLHEKSSSQDANVMIQIINQRIRKQSVLKPLCKGFERQSFRNRVEFERGVMDHHLDKLIAKERRIRGVSPKKKSTSSLLDPGGVEEKQELPSNKKTIPCHLNTNQSFLKLFRNQGTNNGDPENITNIVANLTFDLGKKTQSVSAFARNMEPEKEVKYEQEFLQSLCQIDEESFNNMNDHVNQTLNLDSIKNPVKKQKLLQKMFRKIQKQIKGRKEQIPMKNPPLERQSIQRTFTKLTGKFIYIPKDQQQKQSSNSLNDQASLIEVSNENSTPHISTPNLDTPNKFDLNTPILNNERLQKTNSLTELNKADTVLESLELSKPDDTSAKARKMLRVIGNNMHQ